MLVAGNWFLVTSRKHTTKEQCINCGNLRRGGFFFGSIGFGGHAAGTHRLFAALHTLVIALGARDDVDDHAAVVLSACFASPVILAQGAALACNETARGERVMRAAFACFRAVDPHSYYHKSYTVRYFSAACNFTSCTRKG